MDTSTQRSPELRAMGFSVGASRLWHRGNFVDWTDFLRFGIGRRVRDDVADVGMCAENMFVGTELSLGRPISFRYAQARRWRDLSRCQHGRAGSPSADFGWMGAPSIASE